jgi:colanic acid/amylovoran biosynthesis protein
MAGGRPVVAISLIVYAKPAFWPSTWLQNRALYERYIGQMAEVVSELLKRSYFLLFVSSSLGDDDGVITEILERLDEDSRRRLGRQIHIPAISKWANLVSLLRDVDVLIASRLHSAILSFVAQTPTIAISYDRKVDWVMQDLGQTEYVLQIGDFVAADVIRAVKRMELQRGLAVAQISSYVDRSLSMFARQYDCLAKLAQAARQ